MTAPVIISLASLMFCVLSFFYFRFYIKRRTSQEQILRDIREGVDEILTEIDRITDEDILLIEERENKLRGIIEEADRRMKVYAEGLSRRWTAAEAYAELGRKGGRVRPEGKAPADESAAAVRRGPPLPEAAGFSGAPPPGAAPSAEGAGEAPPRSLGERARELAGSGLSPRIIASRLGVSIAEAELVLALQEPKKPV
jgi:hypothetical protein